MPNVINIVININEMVMPMKYMYKGILITIFDIYTLYMHNQSIIPTSSDVFNINILLLI